MQHHFDVDIAKDYGILEAILINNLWFWIEKNRANGKNYYDGSYWTFNSTRAFTELFPYVSEKQIKRALTHLREEEILKTGNYNKLSFDRTLWYAFTDKGMALVQKGTSHCSKKSDGKDQEGQPIPYINTDLKNPNNNNNSPAKAEPTTSLIVEIVEYMNKCGEIEDFKIKKTFNYNPKTNKTINLIKARIKEGNTLEDFKDVIYLCYNKFIEHQYKGLNGRPSVQYYRPETLFSGKMDNYKNEYKILIGE